MYKRMRSDNNELRLSGCVTEKVLLKKIEPDTNCLTRTYICHKHILLFWFCSMTPVVSLELALPSFLLFLTHSIYLAQPLAIILLLI